MARNRCGTGFFLNESGCPGSFRRVASCPWLFSSLPRCCLSVAPTTLALSSLERRASHHSPSFLHQGLGMRMMAVYRVPPTAIVTRVFTMIHQGTGAITIERRCSCYCSGGACALSDGALLSWHLNMVFAGVVSVTPTCTCVGFQVWRRHNCRRRMPAVHNYRQLSFWILLQHICM